jgi:hypothetical protein
MRRRWMHVVKICGHAVGVGNLILLLCGGVTMWTLGLAVVLAPFTLALALRLTAWVACNLVGLALGDCQERIELLVCAVGALQPPRAGERYQEAMLAEVNAANPKELRAIRTNLAATAPRTILAAWAPRPRPLRSGPASR